MDDLSATDTPPPGKRTHRSPRWTVWLPSVALVAAALMVVLAWLSARTIAANTRLALDGRVLGLANDVERQLREDGLAFAPAVLVAAIEAAGGEVTGLILVDRDGRQVAAAGTVLDRPAARQVEVYLGRPGARTAGGGPGQPGGRGRPGSPGGGRHTLVIHADPAAEAPPLAARLIVPGAIAAGIAFVGLAILGGRLLERQRQLDLELAGRRRLEALGRAGAGLAHQLRTPLATIKGSCQLVNEEMADTPSSRRLRAAVAEAERMERLLSLLLDYARPLTPQPSNVALIAVLRPLAERHRQVVLKLDDSLMVRADPEHLAQLLGNLVDNAIHATDETIEVSAHHLAGSEVRIEIADRGPGPGTDPEHLFEPYVTRRASGTGLGLPIARMLAEVNGGCITLGDRPGGGCLARVVLPAAGEDA